MKDLWPSASAIRSLRRLGALLSVPYVLSGCGFDSGVISNETDEELVVTATMMSTKVVHNPAMALGLRQYFLAYCLDGLAYEVTIDAESIDGARTLQQVVTFQCGQSSAWAIRDDANGELLVEEVPFQ
jgi:hypothetical protein